MRIKSFPFHASVSEFIEKHDLVYVIEQNRDAQMKSLLKVECQADEQQMHSVLNYNGLLITAEHIEQAILDSMQKLEASREVPA